jgi:RND family efflux transporter MFP subunit
MWLNNNSMIRFAQALAALPAAPRRAFVRRAVAAGLVATAAAAAAGTNGPAALATVPAGGSGAAATEGWDGVVQAVRQTAVAAQVAGAVFALPVKAGDTVKAGQVLLRLDARAAEQTAAAGRAQVDAARAAQQVATKEFERQKELHKQHYISQAALDRAEAQYRATQAEVQAQLASAGAATTQSGFYVVRAPYDGIVADVAVVLGDMAMPGRALLVVYDPKQLRVAAALPQTVATRLAPGAAPRVELPALPADRAWQQPLKTQLLPTLDPATHTMELRLDLPAGLAGVQPGMFARVWLPGSTQAAADARVWVPAGAVVRRAEMTGVYVVGDDGRPLLRQVRLGRAQGDRIEVLAGVSAGERVALDPQAAARVR